jgi:ribosome-binding factor A
MPKSYPRSDRLSDAILRELAVAIQTMSDPRIRWVTLSAVRLTPDYSLAEVYFTVLEDERRVGIQEALTQAAGFLRSHLAKKLTQRKVPQLRFTYDQTLERANRIQSLLNSSMACPIS